MQDRRKHPQGIRDDEGEKNQRHGAAESGARARSQEEQAQGGQSHQERLWCDDFRGAPDQAGKAAGVGPIQFEPARMGDVTRENPEHAQVAEQQETENLQADQPDAVVVHPQVPQVKRRQPDRSECDARLIRVGKRRATQKPLATRHTSPIQMLRSITRSPVHERSVKRSPPGLLRVSPDDAALLDSHAVVVQRGANVPDEIRMALA